MKKFILIVLILFSSLLGANTLKIATYNVENLFDLYKDGYEYKEYIPYGHARWNRKNYQIKLNNISRVIADMNADIIALQEIESLQALKDLRKKLQQKGIYYKYYAIANLKNTTVKVALLSKIPFVYAKEIAVASSFRFRNILEVKYNYKGQEFYILVNHWKSKSGPESMRLRSAKVLKKRIAELGYNKKIIALGDFNSDYEEYKSFKRKRRLNDTNGITGINHILGTINYQKPVFHLKLDDGDLYNLWYDLPKYLRYTHTYKKYKEALDSILISNALLNGRGLQYKKHSFTPFRAPYLFDKKHHVYRWQMTRKKNGKHKGKGYSDHLPLMATFTY